MTATPRHPRYLPSSVRSTAARLQDEAVDGGTEEFIVTLIDASPQWTTAPESKALEMTRAVEQVRLAEEQLARRRQATCGPSPMSREIVRLVAEASDRDEPISPKDLARELKVSSASIAPALAKLEAARVITAQPHPTDRRSKVLLPMRRIDPLEGLDTTARLIHDRAATLDPAHAEIITAFLDDLADLISRECRG